jgi:bifunctional non-homologous end joining protein LigD
MALYAFDLMHLDGADVTKLPLERRKAALAKLLGKGYEPLRLSESLAENGPTLLKHACKLGLEGVISKLADAPYHSGRGHAWVKAKCSDRQEFVVAGFAPASNDARGRGPRAWRLRPRQAQIFRPHRHRLHSRQRPRDLSQA